MTPSRPPVDDMVVDTSAIIAMLLGEAVGLNIARALSASTSAVMSAATRTELGIVAEARSGPDAPAHLQSLLDDAGIDVIPLDGHGAKRAVDSWRRYGKGRHPAGLNFVDCFTHALAANFELPILCVGDDFSRTDVEVVDLSRWGL